MLQPTSYLAQVQSALNRAQEAKVRAILRYETTRTTIELSLHVIEKYRELIQERDRKSH